MAKETKCIAIGAQNCFMRENDTNEAGTKTAMEVCCVTCADRCATLDIPNDENPIAVPKNLVPQSVSADTKETVCCDAEPTTQIHTCTPRNLFDSVNQSGDDIWRTYFYTMLFANCERQARGLKPYLMCSGDKMEGIGRHNICWQIRPLQQRLIAGGPNIGLAFKLNANENSEDDNRNMHALGP